jgi:hypothetical protein
MCKEAMHLMWVNADQVLEVTEELLAESQQETVSQRRCGSLHVISSCLPVLSRDRCASALSQLPVVTCKIKEGNDFRWEGDALKKALLKGANAGDMGPTYRYCSVTE